MNQNDKNDHVIISELTEYFDEMSAGRNEKISANPIVNYEQLVRSRTVLELLKPKNNESILDIGCGNARDIVQIIEAGAHITGVDISEGMVNEAKQELQALGVNDVALMVGDATNLEFVDNTFDKVLCSEVIEHIPDADKALSEMWRVLKPGGILVLSTPNPISWYGFDRYVVWKKILRKKWNHPCDDWRSMKELLSMTKSKGFLCDQKAGACYIPGFLITYFVLPTVMQKILVKLVRLFEPIFARTIPQYAYMVCVAVVKQDIK